MTTARPTPRPSSSRTSPRIGEPPHDEASAATPTTPARQLVGDRAHRRLLAHRPDPALPRRRRRPQDARPAHRRHRASNGRTPSAGRTSPRRGSGRTSRRRSRTRRSSPSGAVVFTLLTSSIVAYAHRAEHPPAVLQGRVLLLPGGAVHPVPDHHAAAREADRAPGAGQPGGHDHPVHDLRAVAEHLHLHRLHPLDPDRAGGSGADRRRVDVAGVPVRSSSRC